MTTRTKKKLVTSAEISPIIKNRIENTWILLAKESLLSNDSFHIITLPHPGQGHDSKYCLDDSNKKIYEVITFSEPYRSWFIGESVKSDGSVLMATPVNPLFLLLPRLREHCSQRAVPLEDLLSEKGFDKIIDYVKNMDSIADLKGPPDLRAYKYNEEKTLTWLESKVRKLALVLRKENIHVTSGAISTTFITSNLSNDHIDEDFYLKYAHGIISDYVEQHIADLLEKRFNFKLEIIESFGTKRKSEIGDDMDSKRIKCEPTESDIKENSFSNTSITELKKPKQLTAKEKARQKAASGTKTLSAFFTKK